MWKRMLWAASLGAGALSAHAETATTTTTPATVPVISCAGCSAAQMQTKAATQPVGLVFIYDLNASVMRKYVVDRDSTCSTPPSTEGAGSTSDMAEVTVADGATNAGPITDCGGFKYATELTPVDQIMRDLLTSMVNLKRLKPSGDWANGRIGVERFGHKPGTNIDFDPRKVAWDYPNGDYITFTNQLRFVFQDRTRLAQVDPALAEEVFGIQLRFNGPITITAAQTPTVQVQIDATSTNQLFLKICNPNADCIQYDVRTTGGVLDLRYEGVFDLDGHQYPSPNEEIPHNPLWRFEDGSSETHFSSFLRERGVSVIYPGTGLCQEWIVSCLYGERHQLVGCRADCTR